MLIRCPRCSAGYEFPVEQLPPGGLRAKCARCAFVMLVKPDLGAVDPESGEARVPFRPREGGSEVTTVSRHKEEKAVEEGPSIVVDIGQLSADEAPPPPPEEAPNTEERAVSAFSPLAGGRRPTPAALNAITALSQLDDEPIDLTDMEVIIRPPGLWRLWVAVFLLVAGGLFLFVWARNDWAPIWRDPVTAFKTSLEPKERPRIRLEPPPRPVLLDEAQGELKVVDVTARAIGAKPRRGMWVQGIIRNDTNRTQKAIGVEVSLSATEEGPPLHARVVACCAPIDEALADILLANPSDPHFDARPQWDAAARLAPGEQRVFGAIFQDAGSAQHPRARIKFSETETPEDVPAAPPSDGP